MSTQVRCKQCGNVFESDVNGATGHEICPQCSAVKPHESLGEKIKDGFRAAAESLGTAIGEAKFGGE